MTKEEFINQIAPYARADMAASGVLASVTMAQAILESGYGNTDLALNANNLFGMKCVLSGNSWPGTTWDGISKYGKYTKEDDGTGNLQDVYAEFRSYPSYVESIADHSAYLVGAMNGCMKRYAGLSGETDPKTAITIIKSGGYATDSKYVDKVMAVIQEWNLTQYDTGGDKTMKVCLDAGHYGKYNKSPCDARYYESEMVWKLHLILKSYLETYGIQVITTRSEQEKDLALYSRGAASAGCDLFISLHSNAVGAGVNDTIDYPVSYCAIDGRADQVGSDLAECVKTVMNTSQKARIEHRKGSNGDYYGVIRGATAVGTPGLILEHSFHTNSAATAWLLNDANLEKLAKAEAKVIASWLGATGQKETGWVSDALGERFYLDSDRYVTNDWYYYDGKWFWFDGSGHMVTNTWYKYKDKWYYLGEDGAMCTGLINDKGEWYYLDQEGRMVTDVVILTPDKDGALEYPKLAE
jgi:N-acetylmuramoyl-L-alanine amidase